MMYGNCFTGAVVLMVKYRTTKLRALPCLSPDGNKALVPHFIVDTPEGPKHYQCRKKIIRGTFWWLCYRGRFTAYVPKQRL